MGWYFVGFDLRKRLVNSRVWVQPSLQLELNCDLSDHISSILVAHKKVYVHERYRRGTKPLWPLFHSRAFDLRLQDRVAVEEAAGAETAVLLGDVAVSGAADGVAVPDPLPVPDEESPGMDPRI